MKELSSNFRDNALFLPMPKKASKHFWLKSQIRSRTFIWLLEILEISYTFTDKYTHTHTDIYYIQKIQFIYTSTYSNNLQKNK